MITEIEDIEMFKNIINDNKNVVIDLYADWCRPCKRLAPELDKLSVKYSDTIKFYKLDIDKINDMGIDIDIPETIPTILYYKNNEEIERLSTSDIKTIENNFILF
jgi:thioredoxin 1